MPFCNETFQLSVGVYLFLLTLIILASNCSTEAGYTLYVPLQAATVQVIKEVLKARVVELLLNLI
jgi:heme/copper-type cytochrome/quinol oxidase subunit 1